MESSSFTTVGFGLRFWVAPGIGVDDDAGQAADQHTAGHGHSAFHLHAVAHLHFNWVVVRLGDSGGEHRFALHADRAGGDAALAEGCLDGGPRRRTAHDPILVLAAGDRGAPRQHQATRGDGDHDLQWTVLPERARSAPKGCIAINQ